MSFRNFHKNVIPALIAFSIISDFCNAQISNLKFNNIGLEQGLSQSTAYSIVQDAQGFMWFATQDGLDRYDGYSVTIYKHKLNDENSIIDNTVSCLLSDSPENLWVGTFKSGLDKYDIRRNKFYHHIHSEKDSGSICDNRVNVLFEDSNRNIWVGTNNGLDLYDRVTNTFIHYFYNSKSVKLVNAICEDRDKILWVGTSNGLFKIDLNNPSKITQFENLNSNSGAASVGRVISLFPDNSGILWIGIEDDVLKSYDKKNNMFINYPQSIKGVRPIISNSDDFLLFGSLYTPGLRILNLKTKKITKISDTQNDLVISLFKDKSGIIWAGTFFHGISTFDQRKYRFVHYLNNPGNPDVVMSIFEDHNNDLWIGTFGNGIKYFSDNRNKIVSFINNPKYVNSISNNRVLAIAESPNDVFWFGTISGGLDRYNKLTGTFKHFKQRSSSNPNGLSSNDITSLYKDRKNNLWIGHYYGGIDVYNNSNDTFTNLVPKAIDSISISGSTITIFREDKKGSIWIGTHGSGLFNYSPESGSFRQFILSRENQKVNADSNNIKGISAFYIDDNGIIWIGSDGDGLIRFDPTTESSTFYTIKNNTPANTIYGVLPDSSGNLWLSTNFGISRFNIKTNTFRTYDKYDGLQSNEFNQGAYFMGYDGELFFGGVNGFNSFFPDRINDNENIPPVYITSFKVFDKVINLPGSITSTREIELSYSQNFFSFEFVALSYTLPEKNKYAYMLVGFDKDWHFVSAQQRYASYTNLDPGEYILRVKGSNNDGVWNETGTSLSIIITPPIWMTWWFRGLLILGFISLGPIIYSRRVKTLKKEKTLQREISHRLIEKQEEERSRIAQEMHDSIGQDMLFIKNRALLTMQNTPADSQTYGQLNQISETSSKSLKTLREISHNLRPPELDRLGLTETLRTILLQARDSTFLKVIGEVEEIDGLLKREMEINVVRILQEALGNILKHSEANECIVEIKKDNGKIYFNINDNGKGFDKNIVNSGANHSVGLGIPGIKERVKILGGNIEIDSAVGKGTRIKINIPVQNEIKI
jgi:signal transduction histidine kinase/ligand-binding sensor domain-containing protein